MNSDLRLKKMGVWRRNGERQTTGVKRKGSGREEGQKGRMWDLEGPEPLRVWGRQEEDAYCSAKTAASCT